MGGAGGGGGLFFGLIFLGLAGLEEGLREGIEDGGEEAIEIGAEGVWFGGVMFGGEGFAWACEGGIFLYEADYFFGEGIFVDAIGEEGGIEFDMAGPFSGVGVAGVVGGLFEAGVDFFAWGGHIAGACDGEEEGLECGEAGCAGGDGGLHFGEAGLELVDGHTGAGEVAGDEIEGEVFEAGDAGSWGGDVVFQEEVNDGDAVGVFDVRGVGFFEGGGDFFTHIGFITDAEMVKKGFVEGGGEMAAGFADLEGELD